MKSQKLLKTTSIYGTVFKLVLESWKAPEEVNIVKYHEEKIVTEINNFKEKKLIEYPFLGEL